MAWSLNFWTARQCSPGCIRPPCSCFLPSGPERRCLEGLFEIEVDSFEIVYEKIKEFYIRKLDYPIYWAGSHPNTEVNWEGDSKGLCRGPEIYWEYFDGFIAIIAEKYLDEITISILYAYDKTIVDYGKYVTFPYNVTSEK